LLASAPMLRRLTAAAVLVCCLLPATAGASYKDVIRDCTDNGRLDNAYTQKEYREALAKMPTDVAEYYGCGDIIKRAQQHNAGGGKSSPAGGGSGGGNGPAAPTPEESTQALQDVAAAQRGGGGDQTIANVNVRPGALAYHDFGSVSKLPAPLAALGLLLLGAAVAVAAYLLRGLVRARGAGT
jgi:hypothetical protein